MFEVWRSIPGFQGYEISSLGRVRSSKGGVLKILKPTTKGKGYLGISLFVEGKKNYRYIHRLVLEVFRGPCPEGMEARHVKVNDRKDNRLENLTWGTPQENDQDKDRHGTRQVGELNGRHKLTRDKVVWVRQQLLQGVSERSLADALGVTKENIHAIAVGRSWRSDLVFGPSPQPPGREGGTV